MKFLRRAVPILGVLALVALFFKLPETPNLFGHFKCTGCTSADPYFVLIAAGYFSLVIAISFLFPSVPSRLVARGGFLWAVALGLTLTYFNWPTVCIACIVGHVCNSLIWAVWAFAPALVKSPSSPLRERLCLLLFVPVSVIALFSCLNLTFMAYGHKERQDLSSLTQGDVIPAFSAQTSSGNFITQKEVSSCKGMVINFVSTDCHYCETQLPVLDAAIAQIDSDSYRFINICSRLSQGLMSQHTSSIEWIEDKEGVLSALFKVVGYPTLFVINSQGEITQVFSGVSEQFHANLVTALNTL